MAKAAAGRISLAERLGILALTLAGVYLFFLPVLPPVRAMHLVGDIEGYHHPLAGYAFQSLKEGRFPLWDPWIYCGTSFAANVQAQLFYPPLWLLFLLQWHRKALAFVALQAFTIAHVWILLHCAYWWLRSGRGLPLAASLVGAAVFACTGYVLNDVQHVGVICGIAWLPLALWAVDKSRWWVIAVAMALTFLAGYPATWIACAVAVFFYCLAANPRFVPLATLGVLFSLLLAGMQILPAMELSKLRPEEAVYGVGFPLEYHWRRFYPSSLHDPGFYLYYGFAFLSGFLLVLWHRQGRGMLSVLLLILGGLVFLQNPLNAVTVWANWIPSLTDVMQHWNFQVIFSAAAGLFTALAWAPLANKSRNISIGITVVVFPMILAEQRWFGAERGDLFWIQGNSDRFFREDLRTGGSSITGANAEIVRRLRADRTFRVLTDHGPHPTDMRFYSLANPQGFDPFVTTRFRAEVERFVPFQSNREFEFPPSNEAMLKAFGVRYYLSAEGRMYFEELSKSPLYRKLEPDDSYYKVFEYLGAEPSYRYSGVGPVEILRWTPEVREFRVEGSEAADFALLEQKLPGWTVTVDGVDAVLESYSQAFQKVRVPDGNHVVRFEYRPRSVYWGLGVTLVGLAGMVGSMKLKRR